MKNIFYLMLVAVIAAQTFIDLDQQRLNRAQVRFNSASASTILRLKKDEHNDSANIDTLAGQANSLASGLNQLLSLMSGGKQPQVFSFGENGPIAPDVQTQPSPPPARPPLPEGRVQL